VIIDALLCDLNRPNQVPKPSEVMSLQEHGF